MFYVVGTPIGNFFDFYYYFLFPVPFIFLFISSIALFN